MLLAYAQIYLINVHAYVYTYQLVIEVSLNLYQYFVFGAAKALMCMLIFTDTPEPSLLDNAISIKSYAGSYNLNF